MACPTTVRENVCVEALVSITPAVDVGTIRTFCVGGAMLAGCPGTLQQSCAFRVSQMICVEVPLDFHALATADPTGIVCGTPTVGNCSEALACTNSIGTFRNNLTLVNQLITDAGGSVILGTDSTGLSFTVTTANALAVLDFNTPSPPAPATPPFSAQYEVLYAQLLAANLNVINGATCEFAESAIAAANNFLAMSPPGGMAGAETVQAPLALFNNGNAPGCPAHCLG